MKNPRSSFILAIAWLLVVSVLLTLPGSEFPKDDWLKKNHADKWIHVFLFMMMVLVWCRAYAVKKKVSVNINKIFTWITVAGFLYGIAAELVQHFFIPLRTFEFSDILADGTGCFIGFILSRKYIKK